MHSSKGIDLVCFDGVRLAGQLWLSHRPAPVGHVIINPATGVLARYYHRYAAFLAGHGFEVLTYDYRGIGSSRPERLRGCGYRWRDWGEFDFDAALRFMADRAGGAPLLVVGHSIGGFLPGLAPSARLIDRMFTVGAQYAWWPDYGPNSRTGYFWKWHVAMPLITALCGYFPGRTLGWLEDLPAGVAFEWSFRRKRMEHSYPRHRRAEVLARFASVTAPILAVASFDDDFATPAAMGRALSYYPNAPARIHQLWPNHVDRLEAGHFGLFHARHQGRFWQDSLRWLQDGSNPWAESAGSVHWRL